MCSLINFANLTRVFVNFGQQWSAKAVQCVFLSARTKLDKTQFHAYFDPFWTQRAK
jgi:hypothetical protein